MSNTSSVARKYLSDNKAVVELPDLLSHQLSSWQEFVQDGLTEIFEEINPIDDYTGEKLTLRFKDYEFKTPELTENEARDGNTSYESSLYATVELTNKVTGEVDESEVYLGDYPWMTERASFVVNGAERVMVSQLIRSAGIYFTSEQYGSKKIYGAKVIPGRGAWLDFETAKNGSINVKIDRRRKIPVTTLLRALGLGTDRTIKSLFRHVDQGENSFVDATLDKDPSTNTSEALVEVYRRLRPGDMATVDNAKSLLEDMFFDFQRFDFSRVGRHQLNKRLDLDVENTKENRVLRMEDLTAIIAEIIRLNVSQEPADDMDSLSNRRVKLVGELVQRQFRIGLLRMERNAKDRMSMSDLEEVTPNKLINARPIVAAVREFFASSQLSQFMDQTNPLSELAHKRRLSSMGPGGLSRERAGFEVRDAHATHYGRICTVETPEGANIGLVLNLAQYARINNYGFIETPYRKVVSALLLKDAEGKTTSKDVVDEDGNVVIEQGKTITKADIKKLEKLNKKTAPVKAQVTTEIVYLDSTDEQSAVIAGAGQEYDDDGFFVNPRVSARTGGTESEEVDANDVTHMDAAPQQIVGISAGLIPFLERNYVYRSLMGANQQRQAVPLVRPESPIVGTGLEGPTAKNSGQVITAEEDGEVVSATADEIVIKYKSVGKKTYTPYHFIRSNDGTSMNQKVRVSAGDKVKEGQPIIEGMSIADGELALGHDAMVAFMPWDGYNFEDAIVISQRLVEDDSLTSIHIVDFDIEVRETKLGPEMVTADIPNVSEESLRHLDEEGIVRIGAEVHPGDILVGKITPKGEQELSSEERLLRAIFGEKAKDVRNTSLRMPNGKHGKVVDVKIFTKENGDDLKAGTLMEVQVFVAQMRKIAVGDKLGGRYGNKGVIARVLPVEDMPYMEDGTPVDIMLNPLGVPSRMNIGQLFENHLGMAAKALGIKIASPPFEGASSQKISELLEEAGLPADGKFQLYDGRTGEAMKEKTTVGPMYIIKLKHMIADKIHARSTGPYTMVTQQPLGGKAQNGGQRFGEMEVWALEAYGAANTLQEMLTIKSDDVFGRSKAYESMVKQEPIVGPRIPESFNVLVKEMQGLGLEVDLLKREEKESVDASDVIEAEYEDMSDETVAEVPTESNIDVSSDAAADEFETADKDAAAQANDKDDTNEDEEEETK